MWLINPSLTNQQLKVTEAYLKFLGSYGFCELDSLAAIALLLLLVVHPMAEQLFYDPTAARKPGRHWTCWRHELRFLRIGGGILLLQARVDSLYLMLLYFYSYMKML
jgi:hypothetical protein